MLSQSLYQTYKRYRTLQTDRISALPLVILMPHSSCNCRCVMCDIWKGNQNLKQLTEDDITGLLGTLRKFGTKRVLMSGGEALLNANFFRFCEILRKENIHITLLSTGLTIKKNAAQLVEWVEDIIISLDGDEQTHDIIRNIPGAYNKLKEGIHELRSLDPNFKIAGRTVIHRLNYEIWPAVIRSAKEIGLDTISFLPADVSSQAFNRNIVWESNRQHEILLSKDDLPGLQLVIDTLLKHHQDDFEQGFISESPEKIQKIYEYYAAFYNMNPFPYKKCNAPWVSTVIEADGAVRPCFFHPSLGNIRSNSLETILNSDESIKFRKNLEINKNSTCVKCVCYLNLPAGTII